MKPFDSKQLTIVLLGFGTLVFSYLQGVDGAKAALLNAAVALVMLIAKSPIDGGGPPSPPAALDDAETIPPAPALPADLAGAQ